MAEDTNLTEETLIDGAHVTPAGGGAAVGDSTLTLAELNSILGKDFKDKPTALKALKDTQSFVGKKREDIEAEVRASIQPTASPALEARVQSLANDLFFSQNPQYLGVRALIASMGSTPAEIVETPAFKEVFAKVKVADEVGQTRSVVSTNSRLAETKGAVEEAVKTANARGSTVEDVALVLAREITAQGNAN